MASARLADSLLSLGDLSGARTWISATAQHVAQNSFARTYHLYNSITLSIADRNFARAERQLAELWTQDEAKKKVAQRGIIGMSLMLENARGRMTQAAFDEVELRQIDEDAWRHSEHLPFAVGLFLLLSARGFADEARERIRQYFVHRRREFYDPWPVLSLLHLKKSQHQMLLNAVTGLPALSDTA